MANLPVYRGLFGIGVLSSMKATYTPSQGEDIMFSWVLEKTKLITRYEINTHRLKKLLILLNRFKQTRSL